MTLRSVLLALPVLLSPLPVAAQDFIDLNEAPPLPPNPAVEAQARGDFGIVERPIAVPGGAIQEVWNTAPPEAGVRIVRWAPATSQKVILREGISTKITIPAWDQIREWSLGNQVAFAVREQKTPNALDVWVKVPGYDTSLTITGESGNVYVFYMQGHTWNSNQIPDIVVSLQSLIPLNMQGHPIDPPEPRKDEAEASGPSPLQTAEWVDSIQFDPRKIRHDLEMRGEKSIAPVDLWRDDHFTYLDYGDKFDVLELAAPSKVVDGVDQPVNFRIEGSLMVIEHVGPITLENGGRYVCIRPVSA